jgi:hypothetical protein
MKATKEQIDGELMVIKLFASNYARDLIDIKIKFYIYRYKLIAIEVLC